ncbi:conjugal transfer protein TraN [Sinirhodobacter populi]|uniref:Conjugal transfer protein TraN n=2 Tax=Paenirhodobacter populi TaxID=2306993 RepID=A0A443JRI4_9RHOB|nr:conjugal transfer protein TraN [Sinirhodobacter populi]
MMDSVTLRPQYELETDYIGVQVGDEATTNAEDIAGQYFTSSTATNPACNFSDFSVLEPFERFCDVHSNMQDKTCTISRIVEVDRRDNWRCDIASSEVTVTCTPGPDGACAAADIPEGNPESQCSFIEERCLAWEGGYVREPEADSLLEGLGSLPLQNGWWRIGNTWFAFWDGAWLNWGAGIITTTPPSLTIGEWTYAVDESNRNDQWWYGIYRLKEAEITEGPFFGVEEGLGYGWFDEDGIGGPLIWEGVNYGYHTDAAVIGDCTYYYDYSGEPMTDFSWAPVYNGAAMREFWYPVRRVCKAEATCVQMERDYSCQTSNQCATLAATPACEQTQSSCLTEGESGCELERNDWSCLNDLTDHSPASLLETRIERIEDRLVSSCAPEPAEQGCVAGESICTAGAEVRTIMGFPVSRDCWEYSQGYTCLAEGVENYTDCGPFQADPSCEVIGQTCLSYVEADESLGATPAECQHWEYQYRCGGGIDLPEACTAFNVCVGDLCEGIVDEPNTDFGNAAAWLTVLDEAAKDSEKTIDMQDVTLFSGTARNCKVGALSTINCCNDSGWANGILGDCSESELALMDRIQAKAAVYIGTYCSRRVLGVCLQKRRSYCTFNSQLGMVFQKEIRRLAGSGWGSAKSPNCAGLPLDEIETIDWGEIDLSEAFEDMLNDANVPTTQMVTDYLRDRLELTAGAISDGD